MKFLPLIALIPSLLAFGGNPGKALPKTAPVDNYDEENEALLFNPHANNVNSFWDDGVSSAEDQPLNVPSVSISSDENTMKVSVPVFDDVRRKSKIGALPWQRISYRMGAQVLTGDVAVYIIYYGNWNAQQKNILNEFTGSLGKSSWWNIMRKYYYQKDRLAPKVYVTGNLYVKGVVDNKYSLGTKLEHDALSDLVRYHVNKGDLPQDSTGIYLILTSGDVEEVYKFGDAKMCQDYCGYHLTGNFTNGDKFFYAMTGRPTSCMTGCAGPNIQVSPNGDPATDAMASTIAHELAEVVSDPDDEEIETRAWNFADGQENGDMCAYKFGITEQSRGGVSKYLYNYASHAGRKFLLQQNWDPQLQKCVSSA